MAAAESLWEAAEIADLRYINKWLDTEGDVDRRDEHENTVLLLSARHGQAEVSKLVIDRGADVTAYNCGGDTALHYAASEGLLELVELLIEKGADVNAPNDHGNTPLHYACFWARKEVAQYLVSKGALIAAVNKHGKMPLQRAREALAALLREQGIAAGQSLQEQQMKIRNTEEAEGIAKMKFMMKTNTSWQVVPTTISYLELLTAPTPYAETFKGEWSGFSVAIKVPYQQNYDEAALKTLDEEVVALRKLFSPYLQPLLGGSLTPSSYCIFSELLPNDLSNLLHDGEFVMDQKQALKFALDSCSGLKFLHEHGVTHNALKSTNVLVTTDLQIRLTDYGMTDIFNNSVNREKIYEPYWIAPEAMSKVDLADRKPVDIFAFGMLLYEIVTRQYPFEGMNPMVIGIKMLLEGARPEIPYFVPTHLAQLINLCWQEDPLRRPRAEQIVPILEKLSM